ncbi:hypothetical protein BV25DRAFT_1209552 [Artomyces pyxidatus]|uniref:Uncharacterized protein n=1 Tax=Artomyces pyxidatus TaxID=48021 RepID=A0ACB8SPW9_9AGAM|nr:hypothetical protein BV25DRAFT_1209552 [Artomyces pyxidatus]
MLSRVEHSRRGSEGSVVDGSVTTIVTDASSVTLRSRRARRHTPPQTTMSSHITYGRRAHKRRRRLIDSDDESEGQDDTDAIPPPPAPRSARKRPRMQVEVVVPLSPASKRKPSSSNPVLNDVAIGETYASTSLDVAQSGPHASSSKGSISMAQGSSKSSVGPRDQDSLASLRAQLKREKGFKEHSRAVESASRSQADRLTTPSTGYSLLSPACRFH